MNQVVVPHEIVNDESVTLVEWLFADGQEVRQGQVVARLESSKGVMDVEAPEAGFLRHQAQAGQELPIGAPLCAITHRADEKPGEPGAGHPAPPAPGSVSTRVEPAAAETAPEPPPVPAAPEPVPTPSSTRFSKAARELLQTRGLDPKSFAGQGLVTAARVLESLGQTTPAPRVAPPPAQTTQPGPAQPATPWPDGAPFRSEDPSRAKRAEIQFLGASHKAVVPSMVGVACETAGLKEAFSNPAAGGTTPMAVIISETARLLRKYPILNAFFKEGKTHYYEQVNVGFAVDAGFGLKVPVIRQADTKTAAQIEGEIKEFVFQYLEKALPVSAMTGGTFTVTDLSGAGVHNFVPLINQWQGAILGVGAEFIPKGADRGVYQLLLSFDHQLAEGRVAASFLHDLRSRLAAYEQALRLPAPARPSPVLECSTCQRSVRELDQLRAYLLQRVQSDGEPSMVCSLCASGY